MGRMETETHTPRVLDDSLADRTPTGHVIVTCPVGASDADLMAAAGLLRSRHFGAGVSRYDDGTATVSLWND